jgi:hypothetical protein
MDQEETLVPPRKPLPLKAFARAIAVLAMAGVVYLSLALVPAGHVGVVFDQGSGVQELELREGLNFVVPFWQRAYIVDTRTKVFTYESFVQTSDLQEVTLPIAINYYVDPSRAAEIFQTVGPDVEAKIVVPAAFQASTQAAGLINAEDIANKRAELAQAIAVIVTDRLAERGLIVEFVAVKDAVMDADFIASIKEKVIAEQKAVTAENNVLVALFEAEQARVRAQGTADANRTIQASLSEEILAYLRVTKWNGILPATLATDGSDVFIGVR